MGAKDSKSITESKSSLNPNERRRLTQYLLSKGSSSQFNHLEIQKLWRDVLVPDLLQSYSDCLMRLNTTKKDFIGVEEFVHIYSSLIRGTAEDKAKTIADVVGCQTNTSGNKIVSFNALLKYFSDLLESYFLGLKQRNDEHYRSWTHTKHPERSVMEHIIKGVCSDLTRKADEVQVPDLERWLQQSGVISVLHSYVLGSLYNLEPETKDTVVPRAILPAMKTPLFLDLSQVVYLNSFLPSQNKSRWRFLFSTTTHGESFSQFVKSLTNVGSVLIVVQSETGHVFGGFISESLSPGPRWIGNEDCFLFKLSPTVEIFPATTYNTHYAYLNMNQASLPNGLGMGGQHNYWGLWIDSHFGDGECSESCSTYKNYKTLSSQKKFHINRLEAWGVGDPPPSREESGERSVLDKDPAAREILEMAGHKTYSKGHRDEAHES